MYYVAIREVPVTAIFSKDNNNNLRKFMQYNLIGSANISAVSTNRG